MGFHCATMAEGKLLITGLSLLPKGLLSRIVGALVAIPIPRFARRFVIGTFARAFGADPNEADKPLIDYGSIAKFFIRHLKDGARPVDATAHALVSPADGRLLLAGTVMSGTAMQIKGKPYRVDELLPGGDEAARLSQGTFTTVYLSPKDYHRVHSPVTGRITGYLWVPGTLWPVNAAGVSHIDRLFCRNERLVTFIETDSFGLVAVAMVGATNVGKMTVGHAPDVVTNSGRREIRRVVYDEQVSIERGDELGVFHMGSTVVLITERSNLECTVEPESALKMGELLLRRID